MAAPDLPDSGYSRDRRALVELVGLVLIVAGTIGLVTCAFWYDPLTGWAVLSLVAVAVGIALGYER